jgi:hypothetical protein
MPRPDGGPAGRLRTAHDVEQRSVLRPHMLAFALPGLDRVAAADAGWTWPHFHPRSALNLIVTG